MIGRNNDMNHIATNEIKVTVEETLTGLKLHTAASACVSLLAPTVEAISVTLGFLC